MGTSIRVARVEELPPGKGKVVQLGAREIAVYNLEGRLYAATAGGRAAVEPASACAPTGRAFDALAEDSPVRLGRASDCRAAVEGEYVVLYVEAVGGEAS